MLSKDDIVKLGDLGEAKNLSNTVGRTLAGTVQYMSPEQSKGRLYDEQSETEYSTYKANTDIWFYIYLIAFI